MISANKIEYTDDTIPQNHHDHLKYVFLKEILFEDTHQSETPEAGKM